MRREPDDWLGGPGEQDWIDLPGELATGRDARSTETWSRPSSEGARAAGGRERERVAPRAATHAEVRRRRLVVGMLAVTGAAVLAAVIVVLTRDNGPVTTAAPATTQEPELSSPTTAEEPPAATTPSSTPAPTTTPAPTPAPTTTPAVELPASGKLQPEDRGDAVLKLQRALAALGLDVGTPDGIYGPKTRAAVVELQTANELTPDGIVGPKTAAAINGALSESTG